MLLGCMSSGRGNWTGSRRCDHGFVLSDCRLRVNDLLSVIAAQQLNNLDRPSRVKIIVEALGLDAASSCVGGGFGRLYLRPYQLVVMGI